MAINIEKLTNEIVEGIKRIGLKAIEDIVTESAKAVLREGKIAVTTSAASTTTEGAVEAPPKVTRTRKPAITPEEKANAETVTPNPAPANGKTVASKGSFAAKKPAVAAAKKAAAPKADPTKWNGKSGILPVKEGAAVMVTVEDEFDGEPMKYRVLAVDLNAEKQLTVIPAELDGEPNPEGILPMTAEESSFTPGQVAVVPDGSNIKLVKKTSAKEGV